MSCSETKQASLDAYDAGLRGLAVGQLLRQVENLLHNAHKLSCKLYQFFLS